MTFASVVDTADLAGAATAVLAERRVGHLLDHARALSSARGIAAEIEFLHDSAGDVAGALLARTVPGDLLIAGTHGNSRLSGIATGAVATELAHRATVPLLIARRQSTWDEDPRHILVAVDDSPATTRVVRLAADIAAGCGGYVHLIHVPGAGYGAQMRHRLAELSLEIISRTQSEPIVDVLRGAHVAARIADLARRRQADLLMVGRRGLTGVRALGSVSERLVHAAPCSVLVVPATTP